MTLAVIRVPRGSRTTRKGEASIVPEASHHQITLIARPGSVPVVEHWVMSDSLLHNKYRYDFVSQPPRNRACNFRRLVGDRNLCVGNDSSGRICHCSGDAPEDILGLNANAATDRQ